MSFDTPADNLTFKQTEGFPFSLLSDTEKAVAADYQALRDPSEDFADFPKRVSYLIDPQGTIVKAYDVTDPQGHGGVVIADLAAAQR